MRKTAGKQLILAGGLTLCLAPCAFALQAQLLSGHHLDWAVPPANIYVLSVGISQYSNPDARLNFGGADDAVAMAAAFHTLAGQQQVLTLTDTEATREGIQKALETWAPRLTPEDLFVFFFSGQTLRGGDVEYFLPADVRFKPACSSFSAACIVPETMISDDLLYSWMTQLHARRQVLILDGSNSDTAEPAFDADWRPEACAVGPQEMKRILILSNHGTVLNNPDAPGLLSSMVMDEITNADGHNALTASDLQQAIYSKQFSLPVAFLEHSAVRADLLGGDFVISGPQGQAVQAGSLHLDSLIGPVCTSPHSAVAEAQNPSRGFGTNAGAGTPAPRTATAAPQSYALVVATDNYDHWPHLNNPVFDATTIATDLTHLYGFHVDTLVGPTRRELEDKLNELHSRQYAPEDQLLIFIAGHGDYDATNDMGFLVFKDSAASTGGYDTDMGLMQLRQRIDTIPAKHTLLVMDSCFAGSLDPDIGVGFRGDGYAPLALPELVQRSQSLETRVFITSGSKEYVPDGAPGHHSPFAALFIQALESKGGGDGYLSLAILPRYFQRLQTTARMGSLGHNQAGAEFFFIPAGSSTPQRKGQK